MNKTVVAIIIAVVAVAAAGGLVLNAKNSDKDMAHMDQAQSQTTTNPLLKKESTEVVTTDKVDIVNFAYAPKNIKVKKGTTVTWTQQDATKHDVTPDKDYGDAFKPSELLKKGETYSFTFNTVGTYAYHCSPHPYMKATVEVVE